MPLKLKIAKKTFKIPVYDEDENILATFIVSPLTPSEHKKLLEKHKLIVWDGPEDSKQKRERFEDYDWLAITKERIKMIIQNWEGIFDENDEPLDCTDENKLLVFEYDGKIINYVLKKLTELEEKEKQFKEVKSEQERKN